MTEILKNIRTIAENEVYANLVGKKESSKEHLDSATEEVLDNILANNRRDLNQKIKTYHNVQTSIEERIKLIQEKFMNLRGDKSEFSGLLREKFIQLKGEIERARNSFTLANETLLGDYHGLQSLGNQLKECNTEMIEILRKLNEIEIAAAEKLRNSAEKERKMAAKIIKKYTDEADKKIIAGQNKLLLESDKEAKDSIDKIQKIISQSGERERFFEEVKDIHRKVLEPLTMAIMPWLSLLNNGGTLSTSVFMRYASILLLVLGITVIDYMFIQDIIIKEFDLGTYYKQGKLDSGQWITIYVIPILFSAGLILMKSIISSIGNEQKFPNYIRTIISALYWIVLALLVVSVFITGTDGLHTIKLANDVSLYDFVTRIVIFFMFIPLTVALISHYFIWREFTYFITSLFHFFLRLILLPLTIVVAPFLFFGYLMIRYGQKNIFENPAWTHHISDLKKSLKAIRRNPCVTNVKVPIADMCLYIPALDEKALSNINSIDRVVSENIRQLKMIPKKIKQDLQNIQKVISKGVPLIKMQINEYIHLENSMFNEKNIKSAEIDKIEEQELIPLRSDLKESRINEKNARDNYAKMESEAKTGASIALKKLKE